MVRRSKAFVFTLNNYTDASIQTLQTLECQYMVYGHEVAPTTNTPHLQGYVYFPSQRSLQSVIKKLPGCHVEVRGGSHSQAVTYCKKDGEFHERGNEPQQNGGDALLTRIEKNKRLLDNSYDTLLDTGDINLLQLPLLKKSRLVYFQDRPPYEHRINGDIANRGLWIHGPPGTGKSYYAYNTYPGAYRKAQNKWFDGYTNEETIILDDLDNDCLGHHIKIWCQGYPTPGEVKCGQVNLQHKRFIITSNYTIRQLFSDPVMAEAIERRFEVKHFLVKYTN